MNRSHSFPAQVTNIVNKISVAIRTDSDGSFTLSQRNELRMNISLTPELEQYVNGRVQSGLYHSASEVIREGLRLLEGER